MDRKIEGAVRGLRRLKEDFAMKGSNAQTIERAIQTLTDSSDADRAMPAAMKERLREAMLKRNEELEAIQEKVPDAPGFTVFDAIAVLAAFDDHDPMEN